MSQDLNAQQNKNDMSLMEDDTVKAELLMSGGDATTHAPLNSPPFNDTLTPKHKSISSRRSQERSAYTLKSTSSEKDNTRVKEVESIMSK